MHCLAMPYYMAVCHAADAFALSTYASLLISAIEECGWCPWPTSGQHTSACTAQCFWEVRAQHDLVRPAQTRSCRLAGSCMTHKPRVQCHRRRTQAWGDLLARALAAAPAALGALLDGDAGAEGRVLDLWLAAVFPR